MCVLVRVRVRVRVRVCVRHVCVRVRARVHVRTDARTEIQTRHTEALATERHTHRYRGINSNCDDIRLKYDY